MPSWCAATPFRPQNCEESKAVNDFTPTALIRSIAAMNEGVDFRGRALAAPTDFCIGATVDTNRSVESEVALTRRKIDAGAHFLITQPGFTPESPIRFLQAYERAYSVLPSVPIFFGIQMAAPGSRSFTPMPQSVRECLNAGGSPAHIAVHAIDAFIAEGLTSFYLMPPIYPGGARDYQSAAHVIDHFNPSTN